MTIAERPYYTAQRLAEFADRPTPAQTNSAVMSFTAWLLRPYLDLTLADTCPLHALGVEISYSQLIDPEQPFFAPQTHPQAQFRSIFLKEARLPEYAIEHPAQLDNQLRTERWQRLVELTAGAADATVETRLRLATCLNSLGLYSATASVIPRIAEAEVVRDPFAALLAMKRAHAVWKADPTEPNERENVRSLELATRTCGDSEHHVRLRAAVTLVVYFAKTRRRDRSAVADWRRTAEREYARLKPEEDWRDLLYASAFWRGVSFLPYISGDREMTRNELDRAEVFARGADTGTEARQMLAAQNLHPLLETRTKEAVWAGQPELATARARELVKLDPVDPKVHIALGDVLRERSVAAALDCYREAARLGAPFTALAHFRIGRCLEQLGRDREACNAYRQAVEADRFGASPRQRLTDLQPQAEWGAWMEALESMQRRTRLVK